MKEFIRSSHPFRGICFPLHHNTRELGLIPANRGVAEFSGVLRKYCNTANRTPAVLQEGIACLKEN